MTGNATVRTAGPQREPVVNERIVLCSGLRGRTFAVGPNEIYGMSRPATADNFEV